jgi:hypothetical protein
LCCYSTTEPFFEYRRSYDGHPEYHILIVENKDTYFTLKRLLQEGVYAFGGTSFSMLIYGEGDKILKSFPYIYEIEELRNIDYTVHYFGDLDPKGMSICASLQDSFGASPFFFFYQALLQKHVKKKPPKRKKEQAKSKPDSYAAFLSSFPDDIAKPMVSIVEEQGAYLPQEGLNRKDLKRLSNSEGESEA